MIKTLGLLEDAPDLSSIAPVLHHWADVISNASQHVSLQFIIRQSNHCCQLLIRQSNHCCKNRCTPQYFISLGHLTHLKCKKLRAMCLGNTPCMLNSAHKCVLQCPTGSHDDAAEVQFLICTTVQDTDLVANAYIGML